MKLTLISSDLIEIEVDGQIDLDFRFKIKFAGEIGRESDDVTWLHGIRASCCDIMTFASSNKHLARGFGSESAQTQETGPPGTFAFDVITNNEICISLTLIWINH